MKSDTPKVINLPVVDDRYSILYQELDDVINTTGAGLPSAAVMGILQMLIFDIDIAARDG